MSESDDKSHPKNTRLTNEVFGVGGGITTADKEITGSRLPTSDQGLQCYMYYQREGGLPLKPNKM